MYSLREGFSMIHIFLQVIKRFAFLLHNCNFVLVEREVIYGSRVTARRGDIGILVEYEIVLLPL